MDYAVYISIVVVVVMIAGWAVYVLPTPGDRAPWELMGGFIPAALMLAGVVALTGVFALLLRLGERLWRRRRR